MRESFVFHADYIEDLPQEYKNTYLVYTYNYGIHEVVPKLEGLEQALWIKIQKRIDADKTNYEISTLKKKINAINVRINNNKATENDLKNLNSFKTKLNELNENISFNLRLNELNEVKRTNTPYVSVSDIVSVSDSVSVPVCVSVSDIDAQQVVPEETTPATQFSNNLFKIFSDAGLPCARKNQISFLQTDFKNAMGFIHNSEIYKGFKSQDIERACQNFVTILNSSDTYEGYKHKLNLYSLVQKKWFYELINDNFDFFKIHGDKKDIHENVIKYHDICPECKTRTADWNNDKQKYFCSSCNKYFDEVIYE